MKLINVLLSVMLVSFLFSCSSREVSRIDTKEVVDLSGKWNDTDSRLTAETMVEDVLGRPWLTDFMTSAGKKPVVIVGNIRNKSSEHIVVDVFAKDIERELINSGKVSFVASKEEREQIREERADQQDFSSEETMKKFYREIGADFLLTGIINSVEDKYEGEKVILYQVDLELIDIEKNLKVWLGNKKIKKYIGQGSYAP
ncbi:MAG: penicillin-binding protein activator LpoB [Ignavibacteriae bacterium]|nr:penicillin-binding protein activator LpoB [Ignavibacteriota bacterium]MCB9209180.1 penicillin-binding protein activator LpoB [Ignavibacteriales bacterium]MCB9219570.1 penicillin-binding protein activator LpoB [Ignavibacteriales bacterium]MCB9257828.1 penicillin-binding protein activator LpoB [Ignavibacteriales bacterium]